MNLREYADNLCELAELGLKRTYLPEAGLFCHRESWTSNGSMRLEGVSFRYSAIAVIGLLVAQRNRRLSKWTRPEIDTIQKSLLDARHEVSNLGDRGLLLWALSEGDHPICSTVLDEVREILDAEPNHRMLSRLSALELAFLLTGFVVYLEKGGESRQAEEMCRLAYHALVSLRCVQTSLFFGVSRSDISIQSLRRHVSSFASQIYPIYALSRYYQLTAVPEALQVAQDCASRLVALQTSAGGWCWQYDVRRGSVVETYPLYSVHQDGMAPMALLQMEQYTPGDYTQAIARGMNWLQRDNELGCSMLDQSRLVIWRAIRRRGPSRLNAAILLNSLLATLGISANRNVRTGFTLVREWRPYHPGWILVAWS